MKKDVQFNEADLLESMQDAVAHAKGQLNLKTTKVPKKRTTMTSSEIIRIRKKLRASTPVFAAYLNVSPDTVRGWERIRRHPSGPALRLLEIAAREPKALTG